MAAKSTTTCLKEKAPLLLTRVCKLVAPYLLYAFIAFFHNAVKTLYVFPLTREMSRHLIKMEHTDPSSAEYAGLVEETQHKGKEVLIISTAMALVTLTLAFAKQIVACCFAASSTTCSSSGGDRYSFSGVLLEVTRWDNLKSSLVSTAVVVAVLQLVFIAVLGHNLVAVIGGSELLSVLGFLFLAAFLAFLYLGVLTLTMVAGRRKEYTVLVLVTFLLSALLIPVSEAAVLYLYTEQVIGLGLSLLSVYDLLQVVQDLLYLSAAGVYFQWQWQR